MLSARRPRRVVRGLGHAFLYLSIYLSDFAGYFSYLLTCGFEQLFVLEQQLVTTDAWHHLLHLVRQLLAHQLCPHSLPSVHIELPNGPIPSTARVWRYGLRRPLTLRQHLSDFLPNHRCFWASLHRKPLITIQVVIQACLPSSALALWAPNLTHMLVPGVQRTYLARTHACARRAAYVPSPRHRAHDLSLQVQPDRAGQMPGRVAVYT